jgi:hypothetical protein
MTLMIVFGSSFALNAGDPAELTQITPDDSHEVLMQHLESASDYQEARKLVWEFVGGDLSATALAAPRLLNAPQLVKVKNFMADMGETRLEKLPKGSAQALLEALGHEAEKNLYTHLTFHQVEGIYSGGEVIFGIPLHPNADETIRHPERILTDCIQAILKAAARRPS